MNTISAETLQRANNEAIYNLYIYLAHKVPPTKDEPFKSIILRLDADLKNQNTHNWNGREIYCLNILKNAVNNSKTLADSKIGNLTISKSGLTACSFTRTNGDISVIFKGTGSGEWIDNGEGLSGIPEENTYIFYGNDGNETYRKTIQKDFASDQQAEALNWFRGIVSAGGWNDFTRITVSGHSKGGNKAQFVAVHSDLIDDCYSFDGQGFSPEALASLKEQYGSEYEGRRQKILSLSADNDYVNVLGSRLVPSENIYYFKSRKGLHYLEAILSIDGQFRPLCEQGKLSEYIETVSQELISFPPLIRQYATLGIMNIFQKHFGSEPPVNGDSVSIEKTIAGLAVAIIPVLHHLRELKDIYDTF